MSRYISISAVQNPFPINEDEIGRQIFSVNFEVKSDGYVTDFEREIAKIISNSGLGTLGTDMFAGPGGIPSPSAGNPASGPYIQIINTGGSSPDQSHGDDIYLNMTVMIQVRAASYFTARDRINAIWRVLHGKRGIEIAA